MSTLADLQRGLQHTWQDLGQGWQHMRDRAVHALTRFKPPARKDDLDTAEDLAMLKGSRWAVLPVDVKERSDSVVVQLEAPGMEADNFELNVVDDYLVVRGEKHAQREHAEGDCHVSECAYGMFERTIHLPVQVEEGKAKAKYKRGVLTVTLPKHPRSRRRRIDVQAG